MSSWGSEAARLATEYRDLFLIGGGISGLGMATWRLILAERRDRLDHKVEKNEAQRRAAEATVEWNQRFQEKIAVAMEVGELQKEAGNEVLRCRAVLEMAIMAMSKTPDIDTTAQLHQEDALTVVRKILAHEKTPFAENRRLIDRAEVMKDMLEACIKNGGRLPESYKGKYRTENEKKEE